MPCGLRRGVLFYLLHYGKMRSARSKQVCSGVMFHSAE